MLVGPCRVATARLDDLEDRVDAKIAVWEDGGAALPRIAGQLRRVDAAPTVELGQVEVDGLVVDRLRPDSGTVTPWRRKAAIETVVVPDTGRVRTATGRHRQQSGERVGRA